MGCRSEELSLHLWRLGGRRHRMTTALHATFTRKNEGKPLWVLGSFFELKATGHDTGGHLTVVEMTYPPGKPGAPPHRHNCGEAAYVLEGTIRYHVDGQVFDATP